MVRLFILLAVPGSDERAGDFLEPPLGYFQLVPVAVCILALRFNFCHQHVVARGGGAEFFLRLQSTHGDHCYNGFDGRTVVQSQFG